MNQVYLALGSNLGNREKNIHLAFDQLKMRLTSLSTSRIYETEPLYITKQPKFLNAVLQGSTTLKPYDLLKDLCKAGTSILFYSSDDEELVGLCDRVLVMRDGKIRKELPKLQLTLSSLITASVTSSEELAHAAD